MAWYPSNINDDAYKNMQTFTLTPVSTYAAIDTNWSGTSYKIDHWVHLNICFNINTTPNGAVFATIPAGFRPKYKQSIPLGATGGAVLVSTNGSISGWLDRIGNLAINIIYYVD